MQRSQSDAPLAPPRLTEGNILVEQPTGSGKTMQIATLATMQLGLRFCHAVIATPQTLD